VDQVLEEEKGERWEVLRQSLRAVLHRLAGVGGEKRAPILETELLSES